ncbi:ParB N-terminal domain-containing protein [Sneathiella sp.]|uniref:ParB N-terminal domain-containing protein n=1 Tax=Sneathiella sp. TaxID=1964365 RepID=UPI002FDFF2C1
MSFVELQVSKILAADRLRQADPDYIALLAQSMSERGLMSPIIVGEVSHKASSRGMYPLLAGMHRLEAAKSLGWETIPALISPEADFLQRRLIEIDENLFRRELSALDRAVFLQQRQEIYEVLFPETRAGVAGGLGFRGLTNEKISFAQNTAERIGLTPRSIQMYVRRAKRISPDVREKIATSWIADSGKELDALAKLEPSEQMAVVTAMLGEENPPKSVKAALQIIRGEEPETLSPEEQQMANLQKAWVKASGKVQRQFIAMLRELEVI